MASNYDRRSSSSASPREASARTERRAPREEATDSRRPSSAPMRAERGERVPREGSVAFTAARSGARGRAGDPGRKSYNRRMRVLVLAVVCVASLFLTYIVCVWSPLFQIRRIVVMPTERVSETQVSDLAAIPAGSTLFGFDEAGVEQRLMANPWISSVRLTRNLPDTLTVEVTERKVAAIVMLSNGQAAWRLSTDGVWIEPVELSAITADNGADSYDVQAKNAAANEGVVYVSEAAATLAPEEGKACADEGLLGLIQYIETFTPALRDQIVSACATSKESIAVVLSNGIKVSLGAPDDIELKEQTVLGILDKFQGQISYINVRTPANPTYRGLTDGAASAGTDGASGDALPYQANATQTGDQASADASSTASDASKDASTADGSSTATRQTKDGYSVAIDATDVPDDAAYNGGYYLSDGETWVDYYHDSDGNLIHGYYVTDDSGEETWIDLG